MLYIPGSTLDSSSKVEHLARAMVTMHALCKKLESEDAAEGLEGVVSLSSSYRTDLYLRSFIQAYSIQTSLHLSLSSIISLQYKLRILVSFRRSYSLKIQRTSLAQARTVVNTKT